MTDKIIIMEPCVELMEKAIKNVASKKGIIIDVQRDVNDAITEYDFGGTYAAIMFWIGREFQTLHAAYSAKPRKLGEHPAYKK